MSLPYIILTKYYPHLIQKDPDHIVKIGHYYQLIFTIVWAACLLGFGYFRPISEFEWIQVLMILVIAIWITFIIMMLKSLQTSVDLKRKTPVLKRCKRDYAIGCVGILFCSIIPSTLIAYCGFSMMTNIYIYFVSNITSIVLYYTFIWRIESLCRLEYKTSHYVICIIIYLITFLPGLVWKILYDSKNDSIVFLIVGTYSMALLCCMITLMSIGSGFIKLVDKNRGDGGGVELGTITRNAENQKASAPELKEDEVKCRCSVVDETSSRQVQKQSVDMECEICMEKYDVSVENRTPRILIKCGHTMCHGCIDRILVTKYRLIIFCPFCQQVTPVNAGDAQNLPKNFAILKLI